MIKYTQPDCISQNASKLCDESDKYFSPSSSAKCISLLEQAFADSPQSKKVIIKLSTAYRDFGNVGKSIKLLESAINNVPDDIEYHHHLANSYFERKWNKKAFAKFNECLESDAVYPALVQDFCEYSMDNAEYKSLTSKLKELIDRCHASNPEIVSVCLAMLFICADDASINNIDTGITSGYLSDFALNYKELCTQEFFIDVINYMADTPKTASILPFFNDIADLMAKICPELLKNTIFLKACTEFEISVIIYTNDVSDISIYAMRAVKLRFAQKNDDINLLKYLVFDSKMNLVTCARNNKLDSKDFKKNYRCLWAFVSDFVDGIQKTNDLKQFARQSIYSDLRDPSPELMKTFEKNMSAHDFELLKNALAKFNSPVAPVPKNIPLTRKTSTGLKPVSVKKTSPNEPCPCGSGKKYKKCCKLNNK